MTTLTRVEYQNSTTALADGTFQYVITASVTDLGELPHPNLFVHQATDVVDPTQDVFVRVATPYDLENIPIGRNTSIAAGNTYYLTSALVRKYNDLNTAVQAKDAVKSRINDGVKAWYDFDTTFSGDTTYYHPTADATYEVQLQDAYYAARTTTQEAETALVAAELALSTSRTLAALQAEVVTAYKTQLEYITRAREFWAQFKAAVGTINGSSGFAAATNTYQVFVRQMFTAEVSPTDEMYPIYLASINAQDTTLFTQSGKEPVIGQLDTELNNSYTYLTTNLAQSQAQLVIKNNAVSSATISKKEAEATLASAQTAQDAALATAVLICPSFVPVPA